MNVKRVILNSFRILVWAGWMLCAPLSAQQTGQPQTQQYELGSGDMIRIQVYNEEDLYLESRVSDSGTISYPFLGELRVEGTTPSGLEELITSRLKGDYLIDPKVSVDILEYRPFYVNGEVEKTGAFSIPARDYGA